MDKDYELLDPRIIHTTRELNLYVLEAKERAGAIGISLAQMLGIEEAPMGKIAQKCVKRGPLVTRFYPSNAHV
jgi:hypothetical protein